MYTVHHVAARLGITPRQTRKFLRSLENHTTGARWEFTHHELEDIVSHFSSRPSLLAEDIDVSSPGLPVVALHDHSQRDRFHNLRRERLQRLEEQLHARGVGLHQVDLVATGRILSLREY